MFGGESKVLFSRLIEGGEGYIGGGISLLVELFDSMCTKRWRVAVHE